MLQTLIDKGIQLLEGILFFEIIFLIGTLFWDSNRKETNDDIWNRNYKALLQYSRTHGHCNVPSGYVINEGEMAIPLGTWLKDQHKTKRAGKLGVERLAKFQKLVDEGLLNWERESTVVARTNEWKKCFDALLAFGSTNGHYNVPLDYSVVNNDDGTMVPLGKWLKDQRYAYRAGKLPFDHLAQLQQLVNQGKMYWDDYTVPFQHGGQFDADVFDMDEPATKIMRLEGFQPEASEAATVVVDVMNNAETAE